jgi:catechol 2,3-dioxygenase-like lactoylglutathione lyase family enzyme
MGRYRKIGCRTMMLRVRDLDASLKFYTDQLGMKLPGKLRLSEREIYPRLVGYGDEADK